ncbi:MAG: AbrB/MazE/SpoVT family DNA-binding domain-containing protein [Propionibacteriaceae bacterium]|jgi:AbrB family looped-hinge helix DNA binding protein|nr:AbrB/MazE/SpoVT family DNA-binding domain-containing protein [Propionibacteriaceae bacterium]
MPVATMTSKGQVTVPASIRAAFDLVPGSRLEFTAVNDETIMIRAHAPNLAELYVSLPNNGVHLSLADMDDAIAAAAAESAGLA